MEIFISRITPLKNNPLYSSKVYIIPETSAKVYGACHIIIHVKHNAIVQCMVPTEREQSIVVIIVDLKEENVLWKLNLL